MSSNRIRIILLSLSLSAFFASPLHAAGEGFSPYVDEQGNISRPTGFRDGWSHLGTWLVKDNQHAKGPGVHDVYTPVDVVEAFRRTGQWPDGAVLVKEIRNIESRRLTTGDAQWAGNVTVWFVMIRDRKGRFPDNTAWGEGWGWALFMAENPDTNVNENWKTGDLSNCFACHVPARESDWVFLEGYPAIRDGSE